jgi:hypothetical protein
VCVAFACTELADVTGNSFAAVGASNRWSLGRQCATFGDVACWPALWPVRPGRGRAAGRRSGEPGGGYVTGAGDCDGRAGDAEGAAVLVTGMVWSATVGAPVPYPRRVIVSAEQIDWWFITWSTDVLSAWGSVIGAAMAGAAVIYAVAVSVGERRRRRRSEEEQHLAAVREVYVELNAEFRSAVGREVQYRVRNHTGQTISLVSLVEVEARTRDFDALGWRGEDHSWNDPLIIRSRVPAGERVTFEPVSFVWTAGGDPTIEDPDDVRAVPTIEFQDVAGRRWRRRGNEQPVRVLPPGPFERLKRRVQLARMTRRWKKQRAAVDAK